MDDTTMKKPSAVVIPTRHKSSPPVFLNGNHNKLNGSSSPSPTTFPCVDFELVSLKSSPSASYTSLKDLLPNSPSSLLSPTPATLASGASAAVSSSSSGSSYEISIRNRLVKQAAWAYLQPTVSSSPSSSTRLLFFSGEFFKPIVERFRQAVLETVTRVYDWLVDVLWLILCR